MWMETASQSTRASRRAGCSTKAGKILRMPFSTKTAPLRRAQSHYVKCKRTCTLQSLRLQDWRGILGTKHSAKTSPGRPKCCVSGSKKRSGVRSFPRTHWPSTAKNSFVGSARPMPVTVFLPGSRTLSEHAVWHIRSPMKDHSRDGECERWLKAKRGTIRCPITMGQSGLTTTPW